MLLEAESMGHFLGTGGCLSASLNNGSDSQERKGNLKKIFKPIPILLCR